MTTEHYSISTQVEEPPRGSDRGSWRYTVRGRKGHILDTRYGYESRSEAEGAAHSWLRAYLTRQGRDKSRRRHRTKGAPTFAQQKAIGRKIRLLRHEAKPSKQAQAIAYRMTGVPKRDPEFPASAGPWLTVVFDSSGAAANFAKKIRKVYGYRATVDSANPRKVITNAERWQISELRQKVARRSTPLSVEAHANRDASRHPFAWQLWSVEDGRPAYFVNAYKDKRAAQDKMRRLKRSHPYQRYTLKHRRTDPKRLFR